LNHEAGERREMELKGLSMPTAGTALDEAPQEREIAEL
jgi:hypothetical protein